MNAHTLYNNLMERCQNPDDGFLFKDYQQDGRMVRIFDYRLVSSSKFKLPDAENCRGTMFEIAPDGSMIALLALPMKKFYGLGDNPDTLKLTLNASTVSGIFDKPDGSLMSTYLWNDSLRLKSKGSIHSREVKKAEAFLSLDSTLSHLLHRLTQEYTVDMEYTGPDNTVCLHYDTSKLTILALRHRTTGQECRLKDVLTQEEYTRVAAYDVKNYPVPSTSDEMDAFLNTMAKNNQLEGLVFDMKPGQSCQRFKFTTDSYLALHHAKSAITRDSRDLTDCWAIKEPLHIFLAVYHKKSDDLRHLMRETPAIVSLIQDMEEEVMPKIMAFENQMHAFYEANKHLPKAEYARLASQTFQKIAQVAIQYYIHGTLDITRFVEKNPGVFVQLNDYKKQGPHYGNAFHPRYTPE